jgi:iron(III) transport system substrate-binding protein
MCSTGGFFTLGPRFLAIKRFSFIEYLPSFDLLGRCKLFRLDLDKTAIPDHTPIKILYSMTRFGWLLLAVWMVFFMGCGSSESELVIYSGRSKALVDSLVAQFEDETGIDAEVRYGKDAQLLAAIQEEGAGSPADVFWGNTVGALASARGNDLLARLPENVTSRPGAFRPSHDRWVPVTTRFRVLAYNEDAVSVDELPASVLDLPDLDRFEGRVGWTPTYSSFQDFLTAMTQIHGAESTRTWLTDMQDLSPKAYPSNTPMIQALAAGEIDIALTNHYYILRTKYTGSENQSQADAGRGREAERDARRENPFQLVSIGDDEGGMRGPQVPVETYYFESGDVGNLALVTGAGILQTTEQREHAVRFLTFLHSEQAQRFAAERVNEYPVVPGVEVPDYMLPVEKALELSPQLDFERLRDLDETLQIMREVGLI